MVNGKNLQSGETYDVINPATEEVIGKASKANTEDIQKALKSAEKGLKVWRNTSPWERSKVIRKISDLMKERVDVLSKWLTLEVGKPLTEGPGEIGGRSRYF
jgi:succinate-semialdehyde dehydrogenase/glutarate-semialdehyde dehydrogenase